MSKKEISRASELVLFARAARRVGFSPATAAQLAEAGEFLAPIWVGNRRYVFRTDVEQWLAAKRTETNATSAAA